MKVYNKIREFAKHYLFNGVFKSAYIILPLIFNLICYSYTDNFLTQISITTNETVLKNAQTFIDAILNSLVSSASNLSSNKDIMSIPYLISSSPQSYDLTASNTAWVAHNIKNDYIKNTYIYYPDTDNIYTGSDITPIHFYYMYIYNGETIMSEQIWKDTVLNKASSGFIMVPSSGETKIFFSYLTHSPVSKKILYNTIVELDFEKLIKDATGENTERFFMFTSDGSILNTNPDTPFIDVMREFCYMSHSVDSYYKTADNTEIFKLNSQISNWKYGYIADNENFEKKAVRLKSIILVVCLIYILISFIVIAKSKKSLRDIAGLLPGIKDTDDKEIHNQITSSLSRILAEKEEFAVRLSSQNNILKENILTNILQGKTRFNSSYEEQLNLVGITMEDTMFATIAFCPRDLSKIFNGESGQTNESEKKRLAQFIISNILGETLGNRYKVEFVSMDEFLIAIINFNENQAKNYKSEVSLIIEASLEIIENEFNFSFISAVSNQHISLNCVNDAYNESILCMEYALSSSDNLLFYDEIPIESKKPYYIEAEEEMIKYLMDKNYRKCKRVIQHILYNFQLNKNVSTSVTRSFACDLLSTFFRNLSDSLNDPSIIFAAEIELSSIISKSTTSSAILLKTLTIIEKYLDKYDSSESPESTIDKYNFYLQIKDYIDENYSNPDLSVAELSKVFKINSSYLSNRFKKEFDIGLLDYITSLRIETAKKLLLTTNETNSEISNRIGYLNTRTFIRAFQKQLGMTPKEYRKLNNPSL